MTRVLFLGSSHVSALKGGYDLLEHPQVEARFACAAAADIAFTEVRDGRIVAAPKSTLESTNFGFFFPEGGPSFRERYIRHGVPLHDVGPQILQTAKTEAVELEGLHTIYYVVGASPVDFTRLGEFAAPVGREVRAYALERQIGARFAMRPQLEAIRRDFPAIRHVFVGIPLRMLPSPDVTGLELELIRRKRETIAAGRLNWLFDEVFLPTEDLLHPTLLATQPRFFAGGRQESEVFQGGAPTKSDNRHANGAYGRAVIEGFVLPDLGLTPLRPA